MLGKNFISSFNRFQSRFTYRQKFLFLGILFALAIPTSAYWNLRMSNFSIANIRLHEEGMHYQKLYSNLLFLIAQHGIISTASHSSDAFNPIAVQTLETQINSNFEELAALMEEPVDIIREDPITGNEVKKTALPLTTPLRNLWRQLSSYTEDAKSSLHISPHTRNDLYMNLLNSISMQIHNLDGTFDLTLTMNRVYLDLVQILLETSPHLAILTADFGMRKTMDLEVGNVSDDKSSVLLFKIKESMRNFKNASIRANRSFLRDYGDNNSQLYHQLENSLEQSLNELKFFITLINSNQRAPDLFVKSTVRSLTSLMKNMDSSREIVERILQIEAQRVKWYKYSIVSLLYISCILIGAYLVFHILSGHLLKLMTYIELISNGQFSVDLKINTKDAVGQIGSSFNRMGHEINHVVSQLQKVTSQLEEFSQKISVMADDQESLVVEQESNFQHLESVTGEIAKKSRDLANVMNSLISSSREIILSSGSKLGLDEMQNNMTSLVHVSTDILGSLSKVSGKVSNARHLIHFMTKVSDQAHLLSLNAAIETLNIGKHRQLFSEITRQIQRFAETTASSTHEIQKIVSEMFLRVTMAQNTAKNCINEINVGVNRLLIISNQLSSITKEGEKQTKKFDGVNDVMQEQAQAAENIINTIEGLSIAAKENTASIRHLRQTINALAATTHELHDVLNLFFVRDKSRLSKDNEISTNT